MKKKKQNLRVTYKIAEGISKEEAERRVNRAFSVLFDEVDRRLKNSKNPTSDSGLINSS